jgi:hypothetical protein
VFCPGERGHPPAASAGRRFFLRRRVVPGHGASL